MGSLLYLLKLYIQIYSVSVLLCDTFPQNCIVVAAASVCLEDEFPPNKHFILKIVSEEVGANAFNRYGHTKKHLEDLTVFLLDPDSKMYCSRRIRIKLLPFPSLFFLT